MGNAMEFLWNVLLAAGVIAVFLLLSRSVKRLCRRYLERRKGQDRQRPADRRGQRA